MAGCGGAVTLAMRGAATTKQTSTPAQRRMYAAAPVTPCSSPRRCTTSSPGTCRRSMPALMPPRQKSSPPRDHEVTYIQHATCAGARSTATREAGAAGTVSLPSLARRRIQGGVFAVGRRERAECEGIVELGQHHRKVKALCQMRFVLDFSTMPTMPASVRLEEAHRLVDGARPACTTFAAETARGGRPPGPAFDGCRDPVHHVPGAPNPPLRGDPRQRVRASIRSEAIPRSMSACRAVPEVVVHDHHLHRRMITTSARGGAGAQHQFRRSKVDDDDERRAAGGPASPSGSRPAARTPEP